LNAIREAGKINDNTTLIDFGMKGAAGAGAVYYVNGGKSCLIDAGGNKGEAKRILAFLEANNMKIPDYVILTHSHYDHCEGIHALRDAAERENHRMEVFASETEIPLLEDASYNKVFHPNETFENIHDVTALKDGATLDLGGTTLRVIYTPGHTPGHISILDEQTKNIFVSCCLGLKLADNSFIPPFMPPFWDMDAYLKSVDRLKQEEFDSMCLAHFGYIFGDEAHSILDESVSNCRNWWTVFQSAEEEGKLDDVDYLTGRILSETGMEYPDIGLVDPKLKYGLKMINATRRIRGKDSLLAAEVFMQDSVIPWLTKGYKISTGADS
jgi:glyoxylase-like metal-dependent hydrolase (beta-lactamase superfamily II)